MSDFNERYAREQAERDAARRTLWSKWTVDRDALAQEAAQVWLPLEDVRDVLNRLAGPPLTEMDVYQRLRALWGEEAYCQPPEEELRDECFSRYATEKAKGTEFIAILHSLLEWIETATAQVEHRRRVERERQQVIDDDHKIRSGNSHSQWGKAIGLPGYYCRKQGRLFRFEYPGAVTEIENLEDVAGTLIGDYRTFTEATKAVTALVKKKS